jgi:hypothetical protein
MYTKKRAKMINKFSRYKRVSEYDCHIDKIPETKNEFRGTNRIYALSAVVDETEGSKECGRSHFLTNRPTPCRSPS